MEATVQTINLRLPYCDAKTANDLLVVFRPPTTDPPRLGDVLELDLLHLDAEQEIRNVSQGTSYRMTIKSNDVHDLRLSGGHGTSRFPSADRRRGAA
jgi:hypothetical protein